MANTKRQTGVDSADLNGMDGQAIRRRLAALVELERPRLQRLWTYYTNRMQVQRNLSGDSTRPYRQGQEWGLPARISGFLPGGDGAMAQLADVARKEVVIENDIAWRIDTMVDYLFGRDVILHSAAADEARRAQIQPVLQAILARCGGLLMLQQMALLGAVYGFVDVMVTLDPAALAQLAGTSSTANDETAPGTRQDDEASGCRASGTSAAQQAGRRLTPQELAGLLRIEVIDPSGAMAWTDPADYRVVRLYGQLHVADRAMPADGQSPADSAGNTLGWLSRLSRWFGNAGSPATDTAQVQVLELISPTQWQRYEDGVLVASGGNSLGRLPVVHIQNTAMPFAYSGGSDVEPLIPLQDELNTRLSDRAYRIALQSMKMYLGKNITGFVDQPIGPGRMYESSDPQADIVEVGGDANNPSELAHIQDIREAMDKVSGVAPVAAGAVKGKIGHLTSAAALRITLMSLLARTDRKRAVYGAGLERICELALAWLDLAGVLPTTPEERAVEINWPSPLPENQMEKLDEAKAKLELGVRAATVLAELGYDVP